MLRGSAFNVSVVRVHRLTLYLHVFVLCMRNHIQKLPHEVSQGRIAQVLCAHFATYDCTRSKRAGRRRSGLWFAEHKSHLASSPTHVPDATLDDGTERCLRPNGQRSLEDEPGQDDVGSRARHPTSPTKEAKRGGLSSLRHAILAPGERWWM